MFKHTLLMNEATDTPDAAAPADDGPALPPAFAGQEEIDAEMAAAEPAPAEGDGGKPAAVEPAVEAEAPPPDEQQQGGDDPAAAALEALHALEGRNHQQAQQSQAFTPEVIARAVQSAVEASPANRLVQEALARQQAQQAAAARPQPPGPDGTAADWARFAEASVAYTASQQQNAFQRQLAPIMQSLQTMQRAQQQQQAVAQAERYEQALSASLNALAQKPDNAWLTSGTPAVVATKQAIIRAVYERARGSMTLPQVVAEVAATFGVRGPAPQAVAAQSRTASTTALKAQRAQVKNVPVAPSKGSRAGSAPRGKEATFRSNGMWDALSPDMQELYRQQDRRLQN
jgi:hypothetical protein